DLTVCDRRDHVSQLAFGCSGDPFAQSVRRVGNFVGIRYCVGITEQGSCLEPNSGIALWLAVPSERQRALTVLTEFWCCACGVHYGRNPRGIRTVETVGIACEQIQQFNHGLRK